MGCSLEMRILRCYEEAWLWVVEVNNEGEGSFLEVNSF